MNRIESRELSSQDIYPLIRHVMPVEVDDRFRHILIEAMDVASRMLMSDLHDTRSLGVESILIFLDPKKTSKLAANATAQCILLGKIHNSQSDAKVNYKSIHYLVTELALTGRWPDYIDDGDLDKRDYGDTKRFKTSIYREIGLSKPKPRVYYLAWAILAQALNLVDSADIDSFLSCQFGFVDHLLSSIPASQSTNRDNQSLHMSFYYATCLEVICRHIPAIRSAVSLDQILEVQKLGMLYHTALSEVGNQLLKNLVDTY